MKIGNLEVYGIIYKVTNNINGKVYIGQTTDNNGFDGRYQAKGKNIERIYNYHKRIRDKNYKEGYNYHLLNSLEKHGLNNFKVDKIFDVAFSKEELDIKEKCWIEIYKSYCGDYGYNNRKGGQEGVPSDNLKLKLSEINLGFNIEDVKEIIIDLYINKKYFATQISNYLKTNKNKIIKNETINRWLNKWNIPIRNNSECKIGCCKGKDNYNSKQTILYDLKENKKYIFDCKEECANWMVKNNISKKLNTAKDAIYTSIKLKRPYKKRYSFEIIN